MRRRHRPRMRRVSRRDRRWRTGDRGSSLIEVLVAVILLGLGSAGTLTALSVVIRGSGQSSRSTGARRWLVSASDYLASDAVARVGCTGGEPAVRSAYESAAQSVTSARPPSWASAQIIVVAPILFWNGETYASTCYESSGLRLQLITLRAASPEGKETETITLVKSNG